LLTFIATLFIQQYLCSQSGERSDCLQASTAYPIIADKATNKTIIIATNILFDISSNLLLSLFGIQGIRIIKKTFYLLVKSLEYKSLVSISKSILKLLGRWSINGQKLTFIATLCYIIK
jgi:hypothetical protein